MNQALLQEIERWIEAHRHYRPVRVRKKYVRDAETGRMRIAPASMETDSGFGIITTTHTGKSINPIPPYSLS